MLIDWVTVIAQIINFLILVFLLYRFLYKPILKTMDERQGQIEGRWRKAEEEQRKAEQEATILRQKQQELEEQRQFLMTQAKEEAEQERKRLTEQARQEVEQMRHRWQTALEREQDIFISKLRQQILRQTCRIARQALEDIADVELEKQAIAHFLERLHTLEERDRQELSETIRQEESEVTIQSSFEIPQNQRQTIINTLQKEQLVNGQTVNFITSEDLICGIELQLQNRQITWSLDHYLDTLEAQLIEALQQPKSRDTAIRKNVMT